MKIMHLAVSAALALGIPGALNAQCPPLGSATAGCDIIITVTNSGTTVTAGPSIGIAGGTYDGTEDSLVGIINNSSTPLTSIHLSSSTDIFGFDGDGLNSYGAPTNSSDTTGYGGPNSFFTSISGGGTVGTVNFINALAANGGSAYFGLEEALVPSQVIVGPTVTPEPGTLLLLGTGLAGLTGTIRRRFSK